MGYIVNFFLIYSIAILITQKTKKNINMTIPISVVLIIATIYICGLFNNLKVGIYLLEIIAIASLVYIIYQIYINIKNKTIKKFLKKIITPGLIIYIILFIINIYLNTGRILENYDEFNHWAVITKNMYIYNQYGMFENSAVTFNEYPPFTAVFQYFFLSFENGYSEDILIIAQNTLYFSIIMPIFEKIKFNQIAIKKLLLIIPLIIILPMIFYKNFYLEILVDSFLGILFALSLYIIYIDNDDKKFKYLLLTSYVLALCLTKTTGIVLGILVLIIEIINSIRKKQTQNKKWLVVMLMIIIILVGSWYVKLGIEKGNTNWDFQKIYEKNNLQEENEHIIQKYCRAFLLGNGEITEKDISPVLTILLYISSTLIIYKMLKKSKQEDFKYISIAMIIAILIYFIGTLWMYLKIFEPREAGILASYERYISTILLAGFELNILVLCNTIKINKTIIITIITLLLLFIPYENIVRKYRNNYTYENLILSERIEYEEILKYKEKFNNNDKIYYISTSGFDNKYAIKFTKYLLMPINIGNENLSKIRNSEKFKRRIVKRKLYICIYL